MNSVSLAQVSESESVCSGMCMAPQPLRWADRCVVLAHVGIMSRQRRNGSFGSGACVYALLHSSVLQFVSCVGVSCGGCFSDSDISSSLVVPMAFVRLWSFQSICSAGAQDIAKTTLDDSPSPFGLRLRNCVFAVQARLSQSHCLNRDKGHTGPVRMPTRSSQSHPRQGSRKS